MPKGFCDRIRMAIVQALNVSIKFSSQFGEAGPDGERSVFQVFIDVALFPPGRCVGGPFAPIRQPDLTTHAGTGDLNDLGWGVVGGCADGGHVDQIDLGGRSGEQLKIARGGAIPEEHHLPSGGKLMVRQSGLNLSIVTLPQQIKGMPIRWSGDCGDGVGKGYSQDNHRR